MPEVKREVLVWARETAGLSVEEAARKLHLTDTAQSTAAEKLKSYEDMHKSPTRSLLLRMAKAYRRPLLTFYLDMPPTKGDRGQDFRTLPLQFPVEQDFYVDALIRDIKARQSTIRDTLIDEEEAKPLSYIGSVSTDQGVTRVAQKISELLDLDLQHYRAQPNNESAFTFVRERAERAGILVLLKGNLGSHHTDISVEVFRGFALADSVAPFVVINDRDAKSAWSFTLLHEVAHLLLGATGVSGAFAELQIEKFCNDVASQCLLPETDFINFALPSDQFDKVIEAISNYARAMNISNTQIAYRLYKRGDIDIAEWRQFRDYFRELWRNQRDEDKARNKEKDGGPNFYVVQRHKLGALVDLVERLTYSGALSTTKAGMLLGVRPLKVHRLFDSNQPA